MVQLILAFVTSNRSVIDLVTQAFEYWPGKMDISDGDYGHEAGLLHLQIDKAYHTLNWTPKFCFPKTIELSILWYKYHFNGADSRKPV